MDSFENIWKKQCEAARTIKTRYGDKAAFDYLIGEKLLHFMAAAKDRSEFARHLPAFVSAVREIFLASEIDQHLERLQARLAENARDHDELDLEGSNTAKSDLELLRQISDLLRAPNLGTA
ncbi:hypothetical protein L598_000600001410 [Mesorhizobium sp. J18]|uniref:hypothetical protein n=1 Tax=Mesorhizobium sp. J18 TaxID=935263 RepID=UPI000DDD6E59|nr:hypothetical protein [Mesorhizobium sp. J18]TWG91401.1 hypothetical protein L598_000600001410 [Mesorhizobium sp. J18]